MDLYSQNIIDHYKNPRNRGRLKDGNLAHNEANYSCGDKLSVDLKVENEVIKVFKFTGGGCAISQAAMSILGESIKNKSIDEILELNFSNIKKMLGVPISERRLKCALLGLMTIQNALLKKQGKEMKKWTDYIEE
ncbi:MAG: iron-sulfur cluster assembly scaffold protein [bacterium]|nr:iron-sulfur cluster assembly scaffold protein [bacterium]